MNSNILHYMQNQRITRIVALKQKTFRSKCFIFERIQFYLSAACAQNQILCLPLLFLGWDGGNAYNSYIPKPIANLINIRLGKATAYLKSVMNKTSDRKPHHQQGLPLEKGQKSPLATCRVSSFTVSIK